MATGLRTCADVPFVGTQQFEVPYSTTINLLQRVKANHFTLDVCKRPFIPLWGVKENAAPLLQTYDFLPSTKGNENALVLVGEAAYNASVNWTLNNNQPGATGDTFFQIVPEPPFPTYLYERLNANACIRRRFNEAYNKARQFFTLHAAIAAFDIALFTELHNVLIPAIMREIDKQMMIQPGVYSFDGTSGSVAGTALQTWQTADATLIGLFGIELVTT